jgi:peptidoglycan/xylan/chitin deacetylase (PgdA/CDA1 family)
MARFRVRALVVAAGVPAAFVLASVLLTLGSAGVAASAAEAAVGVAAEQGGPPAPWFVRRGPVRPAHNPVAVSFRSGTTDGVAFITIDDGVFKDPKALRLVDSLHLPVTAFLTTWTIKGKAPYFRAMTRWGSIQNHSSTHASLANSTSNLEHEVCDAQRTLAKDFGTRPWLMRPPYGVGYDRMELQVTADRCGIQRMVLWDAVVDRGRLSVPGGRLRPGDIVLLHFTKDLGKELRIALRAIRQAGLVPANLADYLPAKSTVTP